MEKGGHYDACSACIHIWSDHWLNHATRDESDILGSLYFRWGETPMLYEIEVDQGFSLEDLLQKLGRLERKALGCLKHGDTPTTQASNEGGA